MGDIPESSLETERRGCRFNGLNLFHLLTSSFHAGSAKIYSGKASRWGGVLLLTGFAGGGVK